MLRQGDQMFKASLGYIITEKKKKRKRKFANIRDSDAFFVETLGEQD